MIDDRVETVGAVERHDARVGDASIWFYVDHDRRLVDIAVIRVPTRKRRRGAGTAAFAYALAIADRLHYRARLGASPLDVRTSLGRLVRFYRRHGFEPTGRSINPVGHPEMERSARDRRRRR